MKLRLFAAVLLMLGAVALSSCGDGGDGLSLKEYYAELSRVQAEAGSRTPPAVVDPGDIPADTPPEELRRLLKDGQTAWRELNRTFLDDLKSIKPPAEADAAHEKLVVAIEAIDAWFGEMIAAVDGVDSLEEYDAVLQRSTYRDAEQGFIDACTELERVATDNGLEVNLDCTH